mmetsp:Transcript_17206/g.51481  ORF Transcript_17206/g.51481 Transcript_17206/m.51481 type:complete len:216 (-) Transcript_17206:452-1099(-)
MVGLLIWKLHWQPLMLQLLLRCGRVLSVFSLLLKLCQLTLWIDQFAEGQSRLWPGPQFLHGRLRVPHLHPSWLHLNWIQRIEFLIQIGVGQSGSAYIREGAAKTLQQVMMLRLMAELSLERPVLVFRMLSLLWGLVRKLTLLLLSLMVHEVLHWWVLVLLRKQWLMLKLMYGLRMALMVLLMLKLLLLIQFLQWLLLQRLGLRLLLLLLLLLKLP